MNQMISNDLVEGLLKIFPNYLISIILYGSVARGDDTNESDVDIAIILENEPDSKSLDYLIELSVDLDIKYNKVFSIIDIDYKEFSKWQNTLPFYKNIKEEGVVLWTAA
jgi:predicted nucleotidyltransferase